MKRVYNFSAGPSTMPEEVLKQAAEEMLCYKDSGQSVMEMSHRSPEFNEIITHAEELIREIMNVPDNYKVLFLQGGASTQFAAIPLNFMQKNRKADYIITGNWANKAYQEACKYGDCKIVANSKDKTYSYIPKTKREDFREDADYVYICYNNTIYGTLYPEIPDTGDIPLIADISSCILSEPLDISKFAMVYAGAQKNVAQSGLVIAIIREDMLGNAHPMCPTMLNYQVMAENDSLYNTPNCYGIYICMLVLEYIKKMGGLEEMQKRNIKKADLLYDYLDQSKLFNATVEKPDRSLMNVPFVTPNEELDKKFIAKCKENNIINIKGHRSVGGMRASIYNAMSYEGVEKLVEVMKEFEKENN
ncbi:MAG: 3-phosphoserine/phosphohydroxythreonine transaminase [Clostridia bacterium]|nr:3-phosphoserine/phosphohydroxythreonine transaminase [Clostridia bacterium]